MVNLLWIVPASPFIGFLILALFGGRMSRKTAGTIGVSSIGLSALVAILIGISFMSGSNVSFDQILWNWIGVGNFIPAIGFHLDALSLLMMVVVTFVGFFIHLYSTGYMAESEGYSRFFAYMNLFVGSMLVLVLADNLLFLYLGWEGVGLCSFLLIGFWYKDPANGAAAQKAFIVTRVGDTAMAIGLFILFTQLGTLNIQELLSHAGAQWPIGSGLPLAVALLLLGGAIGKSAQLPLQTWLPDAMAGPTPVSALIHAATMVTAGVYLIARTNVIFDLAPVAQHVVAIIGAATLIISGLSALTQHDIKRVLAYSTISQIGYMFLALGVGAYSAAMFHFMTHAFFKALLFLGAGALIVSLHEEHDMFKMGGMKDRFPIVFWTFLIGGASLAAFPFVTAGFYSKDLIISSARISEIGSFWLWLAAAVGAFITALYTFRMIFITFYGHPKSEARNYGGPEMNLPLVVLAFFAIIAGFVQLPSFMGHFTPFANFMSSVLPSSKIPAEETLMDSVFGLAVMAISLLGIYIAYILYLKKPRAAAEISHASSELGLHHFIYSGWGFDWLYNRLFVFPYRWFARVNKNDIVDLFYTWIAWMSKQFHIMLSQTQTGKIRFYAGAVALGAIITVAIVVFA